MVLCVCIVVGALAAPKPAADDLLGTVDCIRCWFGFWGCFAGVKDNGSMNGKKTKPGESLRGHAAHGLSDLEVGTVGRDDRHNDAKDAQGAPEDFDDQNLDEQ
jgi:hypothetical protein